MRGIPKIQNTEVIACMHACVKHTTHMTTVKLMLGKKELQEPRRGRHINHHNENPDQENAVMHHTEQAPSVHFSTLVFGQRVGDGMSEISTPVTPITY